ncbi:hypothetical protein ANN_16958 [Periplaneta americana]|uniref:Uncharacterized protein n=1 Tax=Periplaneta americana TaxID=6978 RepID=A0ABQ8SRJ8_PERAM|nr:hypothetical protein ANN_16958 [Periplaneta americana]
MESSRLRRLGRNGRNEERPLSKMYKRCPGGRRCISRPRKIWFENTEENEREMAIIIWVDELRTEKMVHSLVEGN